MPNTLLRRLRRMPPVVACIAVALGASACPFGLLCGCGPDPLATGVVYGTVTTAAGGQAGLAIMSVQARLHDCVTGQVITSTPPIPSWYADSTGHYESSIMAPAGVTSDTACVRVVAHTYGVRSPFDSVVVTSIRLRVSTAITDRVRVDLQLP